MEVLQCRAIVRKCTIMHKLMCVIFSSNCVKSTIFFILHNYGRADVIALNHKKCFTPSFALLLFKILQKTTVLVTNVEHCSGFDMPFYHFLFHPHLFPVKLKTQNTLSLTHT